MGKDAETGKSQPKTRRTQPFIVQNSAGRNSITSFSPRDAFTDCA